MLGEEREDEGGRVLPPTRRPDGTLRKEVRIRAGYIPQDEVQRYVAKGTHVSAIRAEGSASYAVLPTLSKDY